MKKFIFVLMIIQGIVYTFFAISGLVAGIDVSLESRLFSLRSALAMLQFFILYIAWRVTPDPKRL